MQRYNPLFEIVRHLVEQKLLGTLLHGYFENYASDENLPAEHWFWDREKSGGIFVEHGVHFFDMFAGWLGTGEVVASQANCRAGTNIEDQVQCTVRYRDALVTSTMALPNPAGSIGKNCVLCLSKAMYCSRGGYPRTRVFTRSPMNQQRGPLPIIRWRENRCPRCVWSK